MVRNRLPADRPEIDCLVMPDLVETVLRHHAAGFLIILRSPREEIERETEIRALRDVRQHANPLVDHFLADPIPGDDGDAVRVGFRHSASSRFLPDKFRAAAGPIPHRRCSVYIVSGIVDIYTAPAPAITKISEIFAQYRHYWPGCLSEFLTGECI